MKKKHLPVEQKLKYIDIIKFISHQTGIGQRTISTTLSDYKKKGTVSSPNKNKIRPTIIEKIDEFDKNAIRRKIHEFWIRKEIPTFQKIFVSINDDPSLPHFKRTSLRRVLKDLSFVYIKKNCNSALTESGKLVCWRQRYLEKIKYYRSHGYPIYYLDETWLDVEETNSKSLVDKTNKSHRNAFLKRLTTRQKNPSGKGTRLIVAHIGSSDGFVVGGLLIFESKNNSNDNYEEMNSNKFYDWFSSILPLLKENAVIVMDNASYHSVRKETFPVAAWSKEKIIQWLSVRGKLVDKRMVKHRLLEEAEEFRTDCDKYVIDELAKENNKIVLRLPPYHCELNPIELVWPFVKHHVTVNNTAFESDVELLYESIELVTPEMWENYISHVMKEEEKLIEIDCITEDLLEEELSASRVLTITGNTSDSESDFDNE